MSRRRAVLPALVLLCVLAGCNVPTDPDSADEERTLTPASVPEPTPEPVTAVPGLSARRVVDERELIGAHRSGLNETSYRLTSDRRVIGPNGTLNRVRTAATVAAGRDAYRFTRVERSGAAWYTAASFARIDVWYREPVARNRFLNDDRTARYWGTDATGAGGPVSDPTRAGFVADALVSVEYRVVNASRSDGGTRYRLVATRTVDDIASVPALLVDARNVSLTATVRADGVVLGYALRYDATFKSRNVSVVERYAIEELGNATVEEPAWLSAANETVAGGG